MTIKQFKKRWVRSMVEPELIYMPVEEKKDGILQLGIYSYIGYNYDTKQYITTRGTVAINGTVVILNSANKIVYNSKNINNGQSSHVVELPYGKYKVKIISAYGAKADNEWRTIVINKSRIIMSIILPWTSFYKVEGWLEHKIKDLCVYNRPSDAYRAEECGELITATENSRYVCSYYECDCDGNENLIYNYYPCNKLPRTVTAGDGTAFGFTGYTPATSSLYSDIPQHDIHFHFINNNGEHYYRDFDNTLHDTTSQDIAEIYVDRYGETITYSKQPLRQFYTELTSYKYSDSYIAKPVSIRDANDTVNVQAYDCAIPLSLYGFTPMIDIIDICNNVLYHGSTWEQLFPEYFALSYFLNWGSTTAYCTVQFFDNITQLNQEIEEIEQYKTPYEVTNMGRANELPTLISESVICSLNTTAFSRVIQFNNQTLRTYTGNSVAKYGNAWVNPEYRSNLIQFEYLYNYTYSDDYDQY